MLDMADHYQKTLGYLDCVEGLRADLADEYSDPNLRRSSVIARLHQDIGVAFKLADIHAALYKGKVLEDVARAVGS